MTRLPRSARAHRDTMTTLHTFRFFIISMIITTTIIESPVSAIAIHRRPREETQISEYDTDREESRADEVVVDPTTDGAIQEAAKQIATTTSAKVYEIKGEPSVEDKIELTTAFILLKTDNGYLKITGLPIYTSSVNGTEPIPTKDVSQTSSTNLNDNDKALDIVELSTAISSNLMTTHTTKPRSSDVTATTTNESSIGTTIDTTTLDNKNRPERKTDLSEIKTIQPNILTTAESISTTSESDGITKNEKRENSSIPTISNRDSDTVESNTNTLPPSWKTYTTIDRKRTPQMITSSTEQDIKTTPIRISLEKILTDTSISSLGQLGESLSSKTTYAFDLSSISPFNKETISTDKSPRDYTTDDSTTAGSSISVVTKEITTTASSTAGSIEPSTAGISSTKAYSTTTGSTVTSSTKEGSTTAGSTATSSTKEGSTTAGSTATSSTKEGSTTTGSTATSSTKEGSTTAGSTATSSTKEGSTTAGSTATTSTKAGSTIGSTKAGSTAAAISNGDPTMSDFNFTSRDTTVTTNTGSTGVYQGSSPRTLQITSKRAGFLDFSAKPVAEEATTIIENYDIPSKFNVSTGYSIQGMYEFESDNDVPEIKNKTNLASQSQLAEDVMREEMLKEEMINNEEENGRHREIDQLSVRPIDKSTLYSVGPNYKPMKKLEVQAAKPFLRSPDDLSWRNESISSLGIVFKAKPAAKNFTDVLKNKTETLFNNINDKDSKNDLPDLRERLEKIAEVRKSKKKKVVDKFGKVSFADYEESSNSAENSRASTTIESITTIIPVTNAFETSEPVITNEPDVTTQISVKHVYDSSTHPDTTRLTTDKLGDYYDAGDEYEDYLSFPKIDLKKFTTRLTSQHTPTTTTTLVTSPFQKPSGFYWPDRKPTLQYFPPRPNTPKIKIQTFDENPINKLNYYALQETTKTLIPVPVTYTTLPTTTQHVFGHKNRQNVAEKGKNDLRKSIYYSQLKGEVPASAARGYEDYTNYHRPTYVIKHFKDLVEKASKEEDKDTDYDLQYKSTLSPVRESTSADLSKNIPKFNLNADYDYDAGFRKDVINRFVDNFNQNSDRFKVDFPILYNNSVVHRKVEDGNEWATSSAFIKRLYESMSGGKPGARGRGECEGCDRNVELPPEYELHYYFPGQEETQDAETPQSVYKVLDNPTRQR